MTSLFETAARLQAAGAAEELLLVILKGTLILAIARLALLALPRASAATRHVIATSTLVAVGLLPLLTVAIPTWDIAMVEPGRASASADAASSRQPQATKTIGALPNETSDGTTTLGTAFSIARVTGVVPDEPLTAMQRAMNVARGSWKGLVIIGVAFAGFLMFVQMLVGIAAVSFAARKAEPFADPAALRELAAARIALSLDREVRLLRSARITVPVVWGVRRPILLLPLDAVTWPADRLRVVLMHELAHLKRLDGISLIATRAALSIWWFHPLAWSLERAGRRECERACDDMALAGGTKASEYADHLLAVARTMPSFDPFRAVTLAMSRKSELEGRLLSILQSNSSRRIFGGSAIAIACAAAVAVVIPVSALRIVAAPTEAEKVAAAEKKIVASSTTVTVTPDIESDIESLEDYLLTLLGKYDKRADKWAREPRNGKEWHQRAFDFYNAERYSEAAVAFSRAAQEGHAPGNALYNAACSHALLGDSTAALEALDAALAAGWNDIDHIAEDSDFDPIRSDPRFAAALQARLSDVSTRRVSKAVKRYETLRAGNTKDEWCNVGLDLLRLRRLDEAIDAFERSIAANYKVSTSMYNLACAYSLKGDVAQGLSWLEKAVDHGFSDEEKLENDPDIALLRTQPAVKSLKMRASDLEMRDCCGNDEGEARSWKEAAAHHRSVVAKYPTSGRAWFNLGYTALQARDFRAAHDAFLRSIALQYRPGTSSYNIACGYALRNQTDLAFEWLKRARDAGFDLADHMRGDDDLDSLHDDPRWDALVASIKQKERNEHVNHVLKTVEGFVESFGQ